MGLLGHIHPGLRVKGIQVHRDEGERVSIFAIMKEFVVGIVVVTIDELPTIEISNY